MLTERGWTLLRASLLVMATVMLSPMSPVWIVFVPFALLLLAFRTDDWMSVAIAAVVLGLGFAGSRPGGMEWYVPRAWSLIAGGAFVGVSAVRSRDGLMDRSLAAIGLALGAVALIGWVRPGILQGVNWWITGEIRQAALVAGGILEQLQGTADPEVRRQMDLTVQRWVAFQQDVYPALLSLATVAALGLAWFGFDRISGRFRSPGPVREFRFSDHLVWLLIGGLVLLVLPLGGKAFRIGENATLFMGGLYLLRGVAILLWIGTAAATSLWSGVLLALAALLLYPVAIGTALVLGLSDTWIDLRARLSRARSKGDT
jgi:hypothetical protein